MRLLILLGILCTVPGSVLAGGGSGWQSFGFDGSAFQKGAPAAAIWVRDGYLPVAGGATAAQEDQLPSGAGAVAVLGFLQSAGGKLRSHPSVVPLAGVAVTLTGNALTITGRTDASGYLILALPAGNYDARLLGFSKKVTVESGKTALVAIKGGKRMVD